MTFCEEGHVPDTELVRFGARDYDPRIGRWTAKLRSTSSGCAVWCQWWYWGVTTA